MKPPSQFRAVPVDFPPKTAPLMVNDTDEPDETSFRAQCDQKRYTSE